MTSVRGFCGAGAQRPFDAVGGEKVYTAAREDKAARLLYKKGSCAPARLLERHEGHVEMLARAATPLDADYGVAQHVAGCSPHGRTRLK